MNVVIDAIREYKETIDFKYKNMQWENDETENNDIEIWQQFEDDGDAFYYGLGEILENAEKALEYYMKAYELGSANVCKKIADIYRYGEVGDADLKKALEYYNTGIERGDMSCYGKMMLLYFADGNIDNALKCWDKCKKLYRLYSEGNF